MAQIDTRMMTDVQRSRMITSSLFDERRHSIRSHRMLPPPSAVRIRFVLVIVLATLLSFEGGARADDEQSASKVFALPNGMQVVVARDPIAPEVTMLLRWAIDIGGGPYDPGLGAIACNLMPHATVHLPHGVTEHARRVGARLTSESDEDSITLRATGRPEAVATILWLWSEEMGFSLPVMTKAAMDKERENMRAQRREKVDNRSLSVLSQVVRTTLLPPGHPYVSSWSQAPEHDYALSDMWTFFDRHLGPESAALVVYGNVDIESVVADITRYFEPIPRGKFAHSFVATTEPLDETRIVVEAPVAAPRVYVEWLTPRYFSKPDGDLDVLARVLGGYNVSRLTWKLKDELGLVSSATAAQSSNRLSSIFEVSATLVPGHTHEQVLAAIDEVVRGLRENEVDGRSYQRALAETFGPRLYRQDVPANRVSMYAQMLLAGAAGFKEVSDVERAAKITPTTMKETAARYLPQGRRVVIFVTPNPSAPATGVVTKKQALPRATETTP